MATTLFRQLMSMVSGECRWIVREDVHVYAFGSRDDAGRFDARRLVFRVVTADRPYASQEWMPAASAVAVIESL
jgi:hypothetical protein